MKQVPEEHPGMQRKLARKSIKNSPIHILIILAFFFSLFAVIKANLNLMNSNMFWELELLDIKTSISLLVVTISLLYARNQFEQGLMPVLDYRIQYKSEPTLDFDSNKVKSNFLACSLRNHSAVAIVTKVNYSITVNKEKIECHDYHDLIRVLGSKNYINKKDYSILFISNGWSLGSNDERVIFESRTNRLINECEVTGLDIKLEFRSLLGDIYEKDIYCIPRRGLSV